MKKPAYVVALLSLLSAGLCGCGSEATLLNSAFINMLSGGVVPVTPGPSAAFVFVRGVNDTGQPVEFFVRIERRVPRTDAEGNITFAPNGEIVTDLVIEREGIQTGAAGQLADLGVLFPCGETPVVRVGLGENYLRTDIAARIGGTVAGGAAGFGVRVGSLSPLRLVEGNFNCGDTIIFRAFSATNVAGGVALTVFLLPGSEQPSEFSGPSTFANFEELLDTRNNQDSP